MAYALASSPFYSSDERPLLLEDQILFVYPVGCPVVYPVFLKIKKKYLNGAIGVLAV